MVTTHVALCLLLHANHMCSSELLRMPACQHVLRGFLAVVSLQIQSSYCVAMNYYISAVPSDMCLE